MTENILVFLETITQNGNIQPHLFSGGHFFDTGETLHLYTRTPLSLSLSFSRSSSLLVARIGRVCLLELQVASQSLSTVDFLHDLLRVLGLLLVFAPSLYLNAVTILHHVRCKKGREGLVPVQLWCYE